MHESVTLRRREFLHTDSCRNLTRGRPCSLFLQASLLRIPGRLAPAAGLGDTKSSFLGGRLGGLVG